MRMHDWSALPEELLNEIVEKLDANVDYLAIRATCKSWRLATQNMPLHYPKQLPLLMLPKDDNGSTHLTFSLSYDKNFQLKLPKADQRPWFCGSSKGWLVAMHEYPLITLWNPFTKAQIELPPLTTLAGMLSFQESRVWRDYKAHFVKWGSVNSFCREYMRNSCIHKLVLSNDPPWHPDSIIMVVFGFCKQLAFCKHEDKKWNSVQAAFYVHDVMYYNKQFYVVDTFGAISRFSADPFPRLVDVIPPLFLQNESYYLLESNGELLQVVKYWFSVDRCKRILDYKVLKLDMESGRRKRMKSLSDCSLFLGRNESVCLSSRDFPGLKKNCIYFAEDSLIVDDAAAQKDDSGIFNMKDGSIIPFPCTSISRIGEPKLLWFHTTCRQNELLEL
ncbi:hypothetical protein ACLOJK_028821 [Asimina triloba]